MEAEDGTGHHGLEEVRVAKRVSREGGGAGLCPGNNTIKQNKNKVNVIDTPSCCIIRVDVLARYHLEN